MAQIGTWDDIFGDKPSEVQSIAEVLAGRIRAADPGCFEEARIGDRAVAFGIGPRKMLDGYAYLMPQSDRVNLGFYYGAALTDPERLMEGTGKSLRHIKVRDQGLAASNAVGSLIHAAIAERRAAS